MLVSEVLKWQWVISWDNPVPADSSSMHAALRKLGKVTPLQTKTSVVFAPRRKTHYQHTRYVLMNNLHPQKGSVFYVNLRSGDAFAYGSKTGFHWKRVT